MAYGKKYLKKSPADFSFVDYMGLCFAGALGIIAAIVTDFRQGADTSALYVMNKWIVQVSGLLGLGEVPLYCVVLILMAVGAMSIFYFQPVSTQAAFAQGFGVLAALLTLAPTTDLGGNAVPVFHIMDETATGDDRLLPPPGEQAIQYRHDAPVPDRMLHDGVYRISDVRVVEVQDHQTTLAKYDMVLAVTLPNGLKSDVASMVRKNLLRGRLHDTGTRQSYNLFQNAGVTISQKGNMLYLRTRLPATTPQTQLYVRLEVDGYKIVQLARVVQAGKTVTWNISMTPSRQPLMLERLNQSYWF